MVNIILSGVVLSVLCYIVSEFAFGDPSKVALDVGLGLLSLTTKAIAVFFGASLLKKEIESRTIYLILSNPVSRSEFFIGKTLGLSLILFLNTIILSVFTTAFYYFWDGVWSTLIFWSILHIFLESVLILLIVLFFSLITNANLAIIFSISTYITGFAIRGVQEIQVVKSNIYLSKISTFISYSIPNFSLFNLKNEVLYQQSLPISYILKSLTYSVGYSALIICGAILILNRKDLD
ncbi:MAG: ABC-type transport system involved in multi-copper enzyme maturation permease subunit [Bacteriovoracaceae bacterium]|jgi:ABC-type transport system involved in multi-copper enzyme maturation permease subunit